MANTPFPINPEYTAMAIAFKNDQLAYIADLVLPRRPVGASEFEWTLYDTAQAFTVPETRVGRTSKPNQVEFTGTRQGSAVIDYALETPVPKTDIDRAPKGYDPLGRAVMQTTDLVMLDRESRVASTVFNLNTYDPTQRTTLSGTGQFSDYTNSDPTTSINTILDVPIRRPNIMVIGRPAWTVLRSHPKLLNALRGQVGTTAGANNAGQASREQVAAYFELDEVIVGESRANTAKPGQTGNYSRLWGKHIALLVRNQMADLVGGGVTFGLTAQFGNKVSGSIADPDIGAYGGQRVRVAESVREVIMSNLAGYFIQNAVA